MNDLSSTGMLESCGISGRSEGESYIYWEPEASLVAQMVKRLLSMQETRVQTPGQEDLLEKEMATHSSTLAWKIPWMEEPGGLQSMGSQRIGHDWATSLSLSLCNTSISLLKRKKEVLNELQG